jgi:hypothetical protein
MVDHGSPDPLALCRFDGVHRLQLGVSPVEVLEGPDPEDLAVEAGAEERDGGMQQPSTSKA